MNTEAFLVSVIAVLLVSSGTGLICWSIGTRQGYDSATADFLKGIKLSEKPCHYLENQTMMDSRARVEAKRDE